MSQNKPRAEAILPSMTKCQESAKRSGSRVRPGYRVSETAPAMTRLLRVLRDVGEPITLAELAERACIETRSLRLACYRLALIERGHMHQHGWRNHHSSGSPMATYLPGPSISPPPPRSEWTVERAREASRAWKARNQDANRQSQASYRAKKRADDKLRSVAANQSMWAILK